MLHPVSGPIMPKSPRSVPVGDTSASNTLVGKVPVYTPKCTSCLCHGSAHKGISTGDKHDSICCSQRYQQEHGRLWSLSQGFFFPLFSSRQTHKENNLNAMATFHGQTCHLPTNKDVNLSIAGGQEHDKQRRDQDLLSLTLFPTYPCVTTLREFPWWSRATTEAQGL